jgi:hypothetical protein
MGRRSKNKRRTEGATATAVVSRKVTAIERRYGTAATGGARAQAACAGTRGAAAAPSASPRVPPAHSLQYRRQLLSAHECKAITAEVVHRLRAALKANEVQREKGSGAHKNAMHFGLTKPQRASFQAAPGFNGSHVGARIFGVHEGLVRAKLLEALFRMDGAQLAALYDHACPDIPRLWPDLPFNGFDLINFGARFFSRTSRGRRRSAGSDADDDDDEESDDEEEASDEP